MGTGNSSTDGASLVKAKAAAKTVKTAKASKAADRDKPLKKRRVKGNLARKKRMAKLFAEALGDGTADDAAVDSEFPAPKPSSDTSKGDSGNSCQATRNFGCSLLL